MEKEWAGTVTVSPLAQSKGRRQANIPTVGVCCVTGWLAGWLAGWLCCVCLSEKVNVCVCVCVCVCVRLSFCTHLLSHSLILARTRHTRTHTHTHACLRPHARSWHVNHAQDYIPTVSERASFPAIVPSCHRAHRMIIPCLTISPSLLRPGGWQRRGLSLCG